MNFVDDGPKRWVCPSDRELTLRAKLRTGWSSRADADALSAAPVGAPPPPGQQSSALPLSAAAAAATTPQAPTSGINEAEQAAIAQVLERANRVQELEDERVRKLNERLEKIKRQARGNGKRNCILCNDKPRFLSKFYTCKDCQSAVCNKCCTDIYELNTGEPALLCKICSESRELLKKTNKWTQLSACPLVAAAAVEQSG